MKIKTFGISATLAAITVLPMAAERIETDILIVGGGTSGVTAGIAASRCGASALIVEETPWVGGMLTSAGVSAVDGNYNLRAGLWGEFLDSLIVRYGSADALKTGWVSNVQFEPSVAQSIFRNMIDREDRLALVTEAKLAGLERIDGVWHACFVKADGENLSVAAPLIIDATELGDVAKRAGVAYDIGMESRYDTGEDVAPESANGIVQDMTYVAVLKDYGHPVEMDCPDGYDPDDFACCAINPRCVAPTEPDRMWDVEKMITYGALPNGKYMINWPVEGNDFYANIIELDDAGRERALESARQFTRCFLYFIHHELGYVSLAPADDEFPTPDRLALIPYHRESRRIHGLVRFTLSDMCSPFGSGSPLYRTCIAVGDYPVDHHHKRYTGGDTLPDLYFHPVPSFGLPLGTLIPRDVDGLVVAEKSISVSNIVNGATRLQPVVLQIGQAAGILAALAVQRGIGVKDISVRDVQARVLAEGGYLLPYLDREPSDPLFAPLQHIGSCGLLRGESHRVGWTNETRIYPDSLLTVADLRLLSDMYPLVTVGRKDDDGYVTFSEVKTLLRTLAEIDSKDGMTDRSLQSVFVNAGMTLPADSLPLTRGQYALLVDRVLRPFESVDVDFSGEFLH